LKKDNPSGKTLATTGGRSKEVNEQFLRLAVGLTEVIDKPSASVFFGMLFRNPGNL
jgi:hypothetical protein